MQGTQGLVEKAIRLRLAAMPSPEQRKQTWLAEQIGVSPFYLSRRMSGEQRFTTDDLDAVAEVFGTDLHGLLATATAVA